MIKTKLFTGFYEVTESHGRFVEIDEEINRFLANVSNLEVIDIKFTCSTDHESGAWYAALMIYKEV